MRTCFTDSLQKLNNLPKVDNTMYSYAKKTPNMAKNRDSQTLPRKSTKVRVYSLHNVHYRLPSKTEYLCHV